MKSKIKNLKLNLSKEVLVTFKWIELKSIIGGTGGVETCRCSRLAEDDGDCGLPIRPRTGINSQ